MYAFACHVNPVTFNGLQIPIHRSEHPTAFILPILVYRQGEIPLSLLGQVGSALQDPVGVAVLWEAQACEHLTNHIKGREYAGKAQRQQ